MGKRPNKTEQTKADLTEAFWQLYAEKPLDKITVGQVCERAGYNRGTFYLHFQDLYALRASIENRLLAGMTDCVESCMKRLCKDSSKLSCIAACADVVLYYERNKAYIATLLSDRGDAAFVYRLKDELKPIWRAYVIGPAAHRSDAEVELLLEYTLTGTLFMISRWLSQPNGVSARELAHLVYDFSIKDMRRKADS